MRLKRSQSTAFIKRKYNRKTSRKLSASDILVLDFLWTWKVASPQILKLVAFSGKSDWWVYKAIRQLISEKYIMPLPRGKYLNQEVLTLTELGFEVVLMDRVDIHQYRYKPHAPAMITLQLAFSLAICGYQIVIKCFSPNRCLQAFDQIISRRIMPMAKDTFPMALLGCKMA